MRGTRLRNIVQDSSFPSFLMLVALIIVNAVLQPGFFTFQSPFIWFTMSMLSEKK